MKEKWGRLLAFVLLLLYDPSILLAASKGESSGLTINSVVESGAAKEYMDPEGVTLIEGFWAKSGSAVTVSTNIVLLQLSDEPRVPPPPRNPDDRSPKPLPDCPDDTYRPCASGETVEASSIAVDIGSNVDLANPPEYYAITGITILQEGANPCRLMLFGNMIDSRYSNKEPRVLADLLLEKCGPPLGLSRIDVSFRQQDRFVRALQVCTHHQPRADPNPFFIPLGRSEIKGLAIRPGEVTPMNELVGTLDNVVSDKRPNCPKRTPGADSEEISEIVGFGSRAGWGNWSSCPDGQLTSGVIAYYTKDKAFSALRVKCKHVRLLSGPGPVKDDQGY